MTAPVCSVCASITPKYKCPICELPYCSLACYKTHKVQHASDPSKASSPAPRIRAQKEVKTQLDFSALSSDPEFVRLLKRYPLLRLQLQTIYGLTLEPGPDEAHMWNRGPLLHSNFRGRGRGIGRGRGGRGGYARPEVEERQHGPWTQEKGDNEANKMIKSMKSGPEREKKAEGMREFIELCKMRFGEAVTGDA